MNPDLQDVNLAALADGTLAGPEWEAWLAAHPDEAAQVAIARRVRALLRELDAAQIRVPEGFEERLMARLSQDRTLLDLLDLSLSGLGRALIELFNLLLNLPATALPQPSS